MAIPKEKPEQEAQSKEIATLGDSQVFVKRDGAGEIQAVKANVKLEEAKKHIYCVQGKWSVTAEGYGRMNEVAGISIITPRTIQLPDGNEVPNPYPIIDPVSKSISKVWVKKIAIGLSPIGNLVVTSSTLLYDIGMYFIQDLYKKVKQNKTMGRICFERYLTDDDKQKGMFLPVENELGIWVDINHAETLKAFETFIQNKLFAERKAQTIAERNALKKHPALATITVIPQGGDGNKSVTIPVIGWQHTFSKEELDDIAEKATKGEPISFHGKEAEIIDTVGEVSEDEMNGTGENVQTSFEDGEIL